MNFIDEKKRYIDIINEKDFELSIEQLRHIHEELFADCSHFAGKIMNYKSAKKDDIMVIYQNLANAIIGQYSINYNEMNVETVVKNISAFAATLWRIHPFIDGNDSAIYIYIHKYLNSMGYDINLDIFNDNRIYFRAALRESFGNTKSEMYCLEQFFKKCLMDNNIELNVNDILYNIKKGHKR